MKDLDFDELDRAVNSLMADVPKTSSPQSQPNEKLLEINTSVSSPSVPQPGNVTVKTHPIPPELTNDRARIAQNPPIARRGGRFMDVVHPSSDMKKIEAPSTAVSRQAEVIEPAQSAVPEPKAAIPPGHKVSAPASMPTPTPVTSVVATKDESASQSLAESDWPDPLEISGFNKESKEKVVEKPVEIPPVDVQEVKINEPPLSSPFLTDTKVDKRPLGANAPFPAPETKEPPQPPIPEALGEQLPATLEDTKPILPEELHNDLMAIESDTTEPSKVEEPKEVPPIPSDKAVSEAAVSAVEAESKEESPEAPEPERRHAPVSTGPVSIPQQYKEEPSSSDLKSGAIYDTDAYHQPLTHPTKVKSGWMWVVWIILILLLGAGVGAALYFFGVV